ncbi:Uncharacterized protein TCM_025192 [Theobroma cacao]|uniref:Sphingolipid delta4-desaturase N-terminal domain-containing protein n=1 Tax=Theobroma cacao TaxID=3641 RepID=A0A061EYT3_THECC|nr:Uncharacterized protein TCM_025192 [Theobroma cacao]
MNPKTKKNKHLVWRKHRMRRRRETDKWFVKKEMRRGERREEEKEEVVMANNFFWSYTNKPHALRRRQILFQYHQIKELFGLNPLAFLKISVVVLLQLWTAMDNFGRLDWILINFEYILLGMDAVDDLGYGTSGTYSIKSTRYVSPLLWFPSSMCIGRVIRLLTLLQAMELIDHRTSWFGG